MPRTPDVVEDAASAAVGLVRRRGALPALVTALGVGATLVAMFFLQQVIQLMGLLRAPDLGVEIVFWGAVVSDVTITILPFTVGYFLALWLVAPIAEQLALRHVIARAVLATGIAATVVFVVRSVVSIVQMVALDRPLFSNSFPIVSSLTDVPGQLLSALQGSLLMFVTVLPLGVLAVVLLWLWRQQHPARYVIEGLIDV